MRITQIEISGLFGMFHHVIPLNKAEHITIIYGINGIGKTMLFKILDSFFNAQFHKLVGFPFSTLRLDFDNEEKIIFNNREKTFIIEHHNAEKGIISFDLSKYKTAPKSEDTNLLRHLQEILPFPISRMTNDRFLLHDTGESVNFQELIDRYGDFLPINYRNKKEKEIANKPFLDKLIANINLYFIQTQRLLSFDYRTNNRGSFERGETRMSKIDTVQKYSEELAALIREKHTEYAKKSEEFELSLGKRLRGKEITIYSDIEELKRENKILEDKRADLKSVGLFEDMKEDNSQIPNMIDEIERAVLSVNIQDMKNKLRIFDELYEKLNIFLDILNNKRFSYKKIAIHPKKGFVFTDANGIVLGATELSSGEQNEIVLLYELLFKVPENSLVLIDEPEISLHVAWQKEFLKDLADIVKVRHFDILLATHSPSIINGNWDLTVELAKNKVILSINA